MVRAKRTFRIPMHSIKVATFRNAVLCMTVSFSLILSCGKSASVAPTNFGTGGTVQSVSGGVIPATGGRGGTGSGGQMGSTGGSGGVGTGVIVLGGSGGLGTGGGSGTGGTAGADASQDSNSLCGGSACRYGEYCCKVDCVSICMPNAHPCTGIVCSPNDAGYEVYPSDCQLRVPRGPDDISCRLQAGTPNYYVCGPSLLGPPCVVQGGGLGSVGGNFCCP